MFPVAWRDARLRAKDWVYGLHVDGYARAWPLSVFENRYILNETFHHKKLTLIATGPLKSIRVYETTGVEFSRFTGDSLLDTRGRKWAIDEDALILQGSAIRLERYPGQRVFWFAWYAFFPKTSLYRDKNKTKF